MSELPDASLPAVLAEIAEIVGVDAVWEIVGAKGGQDIFLPRFCPPDHWLSQLIGKENADKLCAHFRADHVSRLLIPMGSAVQKQRRIAEVLNKELSVNGTAGVLGVHKRTVYRHRRRQRENSGQGSLFD